MTTKKRTPQFAKSTDPDVIAAIEAQTYRAVAFLTRAVAFARVHGGKDAQASVWTGPALDGPGTHMRMTGITNCRRPSGGQWTKGRHGWRPFKSNPLYQDMAAVAEELPGIPGLPNQVAGPTDRDGTRWTLYPDPFIQDGVAYFGLSKAPAVDQSRFGGNLGDQWSGVLASEYADAQDAYNAGVSR